MKTPSRRVITLAATTVAALALAATAAFSASGIAHEAPTSADVPSIQTALPLTTTETAGAYVPLVQTSETSATWSPATEGYSSDSLDYSYTDPITTSPPKSLIGAEDPVESPEAITREVEPSDDEDDEDREIIKPEVRDEEDEVDEDSTRPEQHDDHKDD